MNPSLNSSTLWMNLVKRAFFSMSVSYGLSASISRLASISCLVNFLCWTWSSSTSSEHCPRWPTISSMRWLISREPIPSRITSKKRRVLTIGYLGWGNSERKNLFLTSSPPFFWFRIGLTLFGFKAPFIRHCYESKKSKKLKDFTVL